MIGATEKKTAKTYTTQLQLQLQLQQPQLQQQLELQVQVQLQLITPTPIRTCSPIGGFAIRKVGIAIFQNFLK